MSSSPETRNQSIDLRTSEGVKAVQGAWKYHDVKLVEIDSKAPDGSPNKTYSVEPKAGVAKFDDSSWETIAPETLKDRRSTGKVAAPAQPGNANYPVIEPAPGRYVKLKSN